MGSGGWYLPDREQYIAFQSGVLGLSPLPGVPPESSPSRPRGSSSRQEPGGHRGPSQMGHRPSTLSPKFPRVTLSLLNQGPRQPQSSLPDPGWGAGVGVRPGVSGCHASV